jgi:ribulose-bisphosphate carboxylase small chain
MRITQGTFSFLPDLTDAQIARQLEYAIDRGWAISVEFTDDPHPRNTYWDMWGPPAFNPPDVEAVMADLAACRAANPGRYVKVNAFDSSSGWETVRLSFIVQRPAEERGFTLERQEGPGRLQRYAMQRRAAPGPAGEPR